MDSAILPWNFATTSTLTTSDEPSSLPAGLSEGHETEEERVRAAREKRRSFVTGLKERL